MFVSAHWDKLKGIWGLVKKSYLLYIIVMIKNNKYTKNMKY